MFQQQETWSETVVSEQEFTEAGQKLEAWNTATDFLQLIANGRRPEVVFVTEGYVKQQPLALNYQLPEFERTADLDDLQQAPQLFWCIRANMLNPARLLSRELCGGSSCGFGSKQLHQERLEHAQHEQIPLGVVERCKLLDVQYISKQHTPRQQHQDDNPFGEHQELQPQQRTALTLRITLQRLIDPQQQLLQHAHEQQQLDREICLQESACCSHEHSPAPTDQYQQQQQQQQCLQDQNCRRIQDGIPQTDAWNTQRALICSLEYPVFHLEGNDFIVPAAVFDQGMAEWSQLAPKDEFTMEWDGNPCEGFVEGYRQRKLDDLFWGSPWRSIIIDWKEDPVDRQTAPEDWWHGNPWEMQRLPRSSTAAAAAVVAAPWTPEGAAVARAAAKAAAAAEEARQAKRAAKKRKRASSRAFVYDEFFYDAASIDDGSEPSDTSFFYDDDPEDYIIFNSRRPTQRQRSQRQQQQQRIASAPSSWSSRQRHAAGGPAAAEPRQRGGEAGDSEPAHGWGRELVGVPENVCLICRRGSEKGELVSLHTGKAQQNCCRRYHVGCLLLLNAAGLRTVYLGKQQLKRHQQQRQQAARAGSSAQAAAAAALVAAPGSCNARSDGLLGELQQLLQQPDSGVSEALAAAVAEAEAAAELYAKDELSLACPAHCCHGCGLNGKHEFLVWCCCCWVRTYHCRNCVPLGAEKMVLNGREYICCPYCVAANAPLPLQPPLMPTAAVARTEAAQAAVSEDAQQGDVAALATQAAAALDVGDMPQLAAAATAAAAAAAAAEGVVADVEAAGEADHQPGRAVDGQPAVAGASLDEHPAAAAGAELKKAAAAADKIAAELAQQQLLLQLAGSWELPATTAGQHDWQQQQQRGEPHAGADSQWRQQQQLQDEVLDSHAHTPDVIHVVSDDLEGHVVSASGIICVGDATGGDAVGPVATAAAGPAAAAAGAAESDRLQCAGSNAMTSLLLSDTQELEALQQEIEDLQQLLQLKQQQYRQKQQQLEQKRQQLFSQQCRRETDAPAAAATANAHATAGRAACRAADPVGKAMPGAASVADTAINIVAAGVSANLASSGMVSALDVLAGTGEDIAQAAAENDAVAEAARAHAAAAYAAAAAAAQAPSQDNPAAMPTWLQLSLEDRELRHPSWRLVPVNDEGGVAAEALQHVADAISRLPPVQLQASVSTMTAPTAAAAVGQGSSGGSRGGEPGTMVSSGQGLLLFAPRCHWLIGSREKAEAAKYKVSGSWAGCPVIQVETPDEGVFGVCFVTDHAARLTQARLQQQQQQEDEEKGDASATAAAAAANDGEVARLLRQAEQRRPDVYLRCWKNVTQGGRQRQQQRQQDGEERGSRRGLRGEEWEVLVNGRAFPADIGRDGWKLEHGDVVTVQGLQFKLVAA